jgi:hypothetical protein
VEGTIKLSVSQNRDSYLNTYLGGLIGNHQNGNLTRNCFKGNLKCDATREKDNPNCTVMLGGLIGQVKVDSNTRILIENNYCQAEIVANISNLSSYIGGFSAYLSNNNYLKITNSYAVSNITAEVSLPSNHNWHIAFAHTYTSGFFGYAGGWDDTNVANCWVDASISLKTNNLEGWGSFTSYDINNINYTNTFYANNRPLEADVVLVDSTRTSAAIADDFKKIDFYTNIMKWDTKIWNLVEGEYPTII